MSDQNNTPDTNENEDVKPDELTLLRERATTMGITFSGNTGAETLKKKITAKLAGEAEAEEEEKEEDATKAEAEPERKLTKSEREQEVRQRMKLEKMALVRCRIHNLNPSKKDLQGEIITVGNKYLGTIRKFIPFGEQTDNGYHIPKCIYDDLKARRYQHIRTKTVRGQIEVERRMAPEYNIEVLPPLTKEELAELALNQAAAERVGSN